MNDEIKSRRKDARVPVDLPLKYEVVEKVLVDFPVKYEVVKWNELPHQPETATMVNCSDISVRGLRFNHNLNLTDKAIKKLREGTFKINLAFTLPNDDEPINLLGRVVYSGEGEEKEGGEVNKQSMGILFIDIDSGDYEKIREFVQDKTSDKS